MGDDDPPANDLDEAVSLCAWTPSWAGQAVSEAALISGQLGDDTAIEHIGSTAIPGLIAKPVLDLMVGAARAKDIDRFAGRLASVGWTDLGEAGVQRRRHLRQRSGAAVNVHIVIVGGPHWTNNLLVRNFLRAHPAEVDAYAARKAAIVTGGAIRLLAYSDAKSDFIRNLIGRADQWRRDSTASGIITA